ncbi:MAG: HPP family protein [Gordonia sp. (in: high G+C Gram-positive bacteria)]|uniref:HPP family protein n=1 Tax=Gordonia sp. (in: high G+C Gram-positive bacteria) TaxID=84139 RepID=UPI0039E37962
MPITESVLSHDETRPRRFSSAAPARPPWRTVAVALVAAMTGLLALVALTEGLHQPWFIPPLAASMALIMGAPALPLAQPRNVVGGQVVSSLTGVLVGMIGHSLWWGAVAGAVALAAMTVCRVSHSPAAATAVIGATAATIPGWEFVLFAGASALVLVVVGYIAHRLSAVSYPVYTW